MTDADARLKRLKYTIFKLMSWQGISTSELIEQGYLEENDLD